jgi:hypothetical protein
MTQRLRELVASGLVAVAVLIILWWVLRKIIGLFLWLVNLTVIAAVVILLFAAAHRLRHPKERRPRRRRS